MRTARSSSALVIERLAGFQTKAIRITSEISTQKW